MLPDTGFLWQERLSQLGVDYSHCIEMTELVELLVAKEQGHSTNPFRDSKVSHRSHLELGFSLALLARC